MMAAMVVQVFYKFLWTYMVTGSQLLTHCWLILSAGSSKRLNFLELEFSVFCYVTHDLALAPAVQLKLYLLSTKHMFTLTCTSVAGSSVSTWVSLVFPHTSVLHLSWVPRTWCIELQTSWRTSLTTSGVTSSLCKKSCNFLQNLRIYGQNWLHQYDIVNNFKVQSCKYEAGQLQKW